MTELNKNIEVLAFLSAFLPTAFGFVVESTHNDEQSIKLVLENKDDDGLKLYISVVQLTQEFYSLTFTSKKNTTSLSSSFDFNLDASSLDINLPTTQEKISSVYDQFQGDWLNSTFAGYMLKRLDIVPKKILAEELNVIGEKYLVPVVKGKTGTCDIALLDRFKSALSNVFIIPGATHTISTKQHLKRLNTDDDEEHFNSPTYEKTLNSVDLPTFDDEYEINKRAQPYPSSCGLPSVGTDDIYGPVGKFPDTRPSLTGPIGGFNGMIVDKNHPLFGQGGTGAGIGRFDPPGVAGAPPGARGDDPFGPIDDNVGMGLPYGSSKRGSGRGGFGSMGGPFGGGPPGFSGFM